MDCFGRRTCPSVEAWSEVELVFQMQIHGMYGILKRDENHDFQTGHPFES